MLGWALGGARVPLSVVLLPLPLQALSAPSQARLFASHVAISASLVRTHTQQPQVGQEVEVKVFDGWEMRDVGPAEEGHDLVLGSPYFRIPENSFVWAADQGGQGWWKLGESDTGVRMNKSLYSIPKGAVFQKYKP